MEANTLGIIRKLTERVWGSKGTATRDQELLRRCYFEVLEERRVLSADPVVAGISYREGDGGLDTQPDYFEVSFQGGAATTRMTSFTINGDLDSSGTRNFGDIFFDTNGVGSGGSFPFQFDAANSVGISASDILDVRVSTDGLSLAVDVKDFKAGDKLAFTIDVDEMENLRPDMIVSGVEIEGSLFSTSFVDENYTFSRRRVELDINHSEGFVQTQWSGVFFDDYDQIQAEGGRLAKQALNLTADNQNGQANRTAGTIDVYDLVAKPIEISGMVYHDENANCNRESSESGIGNVFISLQRLNETTGQYQTVATTKTNAQGQYHFGTELDLKPGVFRLVEAQPNDFLSVGAKSGSHGGIVTNDGQQQPNVIGQISVPLGGTVATNYDFCEIRPASISGHVWHDADNDGVFDTNEQPIANVLIQVNRVGAKPGTGPDLFAGTSPVFVRTDANGHYLVTGLPPGIYEVIEINNYPSATNPLAGYIDGKDSLGNVDGTLKGTKSNDRFANIELCAGDAGVRYDFGELKPTSISGFVSLTTPDGTCLDPADPNHVGIAGVRIELYDADGRLVTSTLTNHQGRYEFAGLNPGVYTVVEVQPVGYLDVGQTLGNVQGRSVGTASHDRFSNIMLGSGNAGVMYNFCETVPAEICGTVWHDFNDDAVLDSSEQRIGNVKVQLFDKSGVKLAETTTDAQGNYCFKNLYPGEYCVKQVQPEGWLDAKDSLGKVDNLGRGEMKNDEFCKVTLRAGDKGVEYNFGEVKPVEICGAVWHDFNNDGVISAGEDRIANVTIQLLDKNGGVVAETSTDAQGNYCFTNLYPGEYCVKQVQPSGWVDAKDSLGTIGGATRGTAQNDIFCVTMRSGEKGIDYNFGELKLGRIGGFVHVDNDRNCVFDREQGDRPIANVKLELLNQNGVVIATTLTDQNGAYIFDNLTPGEYSVRQVQPENYFSGGERIGSGGGQASKNLLSGIRVGSGQFLTEYNFCECEISEIRGRVWEDGPAFETPDGNLPTNYREQRDGVFNANVDTPIAGSRLYLYHYVSVSPDDPDVVDLSLRPVTLAEVLPQFYSHLSSSNGNTPIWVETGTDGQYAFQGLKQGSYVVRQEQPEGYFDANDLPGTTTGFTFNSLSSAQTAPQNVLRTFNSEQIMNSIVNIQVQGGGVSRENNFTEVRVQKAPEPPSRPPVVPPLDTPIPRMSNPPGQSPGITGFGGLFGASPTGYTMFAGPPDRVSFLMESKPSDPYTWHLSIINAGDPRNENDGLQTDSSWQQVSYLNNNDWNRFEMGEALWSFADTDGKGKFAVNSHHQRFGAIGGTPLTGDFDGDGKDQVGMFRDGYWMLDMNSNGIWDEKDMLIRFGNADDRPVIGDWDGDGKDDIGIYGPMWEHDPEAIAHEPGLPNPENFPHTRPKNVPPNDHEATNRARVMKLTSFGRQRADVVDHVFGVGDGSITPVSGDWTGTGIRSIGTFKDGAWQLDLNGDGKFDHRDVKARFGQSGDIPVVGDFDGDGIDQIAVFRAGTWIIDSNGNRELDATDHTFLMGGLGDKPIAGDFDGDGIDQPAIYSERGKSF
jgi:protocatechuate 3,4-dioxygenase beta subunit